MGLYLPRMGHRLTRIKAIGLFCFSWQQGRGQRGKPGGNTSWNGGEDPLKHPSSTPGTGGVYWACQRATVLCKAERGRTICQVDRRSRKRVVGGESHEDQDVMRLMIVGPMDSSEERA